MSDGSEESGVVTVAMPGYAMPIGADASTEKGFRALVESIHPAFKESKLADRMVLEGYDRIASVYAFSERKLIEEYDLKEGHAVQFVRAVEQVRRTLGQKKYSL